MQRQGASIIAGSGAVARHERLTVVAGGSVIQGSDDLGRSALEMLDTLAAAGDWSFEAVAGALHQLVLDEDPRGVAAVEADDDGEVLLFAFDRASAQGGEITATGDGRSGWTTQVAGGTDIQLRLDNVPFKAAESGMELRTGLVPGAGALLDVTAFVASAPSQSAMQPLAPAATPTPPAPTPAPRPVVASTPAPPPSSAAAYAAPPPNEKAKVDSSLLPPPPGEWRPGQPAPAPTQYSFDQPGQQLPPPPGGPATTNLPPPPNGASTPGSAPDGPPAMPGSDH